MDILIPVVILAVIGLIAGVGLSLASKFMAVPVDEKQEQIREALPGANCGACGYSGCDGYAAAIASGEAKPDKCSPGGVATSKMLGEILGVAIENEPKIAFIACNGNDTLTTHKYLYDGMQSCTAANLIYSGPMACAYGCVGFGDCSKACPFNAITMQNGRPVVCVDKCVGCGVCTTACPKGLISLVAKDAKVFVACSNKQKGAAVAKSCKVSCLSCMQCEKNCPTGAVKIIDNIAVIDYSLCNGCGKCKEVCKRGVII